MTKVRVSGGKSVLTRRPVNPASQDEVDDGLISNKYVSPATLAGWPGGGGGSMVYPGAGIALSTGSAWGTSITDNSANWNTAFGWGNHAGLYWPLTGTVTLTGNVSIAATSSNYGVSFGDFTNPLGTADFILNYGNKFLVRYGNAGSNFGGGINIDFENVRITSTDGTDVNGLLIDNNSVDLQWGASTRAGVGVDNDGAYLKAGTDAVRFILGSDATGDLHYTNSGSDLSRLGIGSSGQVLTVSGGGLPSWAAPSGGISGLTTNELVYGNSATTIASLPVATYPSLTELANVKGVTNPIQGQLGTKWSLGANGTFTSPLVFTGSTTNTLNFQFPSIGSSVTDRAFVISNETAAASGLQQYSPSLVLRGYGWKTNATAASQSTEIIHQVVPIQSTTAPNATYNIGHSINGASPTTFFSYNNASSNTTLTGGLIAGSITVPAATSHQNIFGGYGNIIAGLRIQQFGGAANHASLTQDYAYALFYNQGWATSSAVTSGIYSTIALRPTYNVSNGAGTGTIYGIDYNPTITSIAGITNHYAARFNSGKLLIGEAPANAASTSDHLLTRDTSTGDVEKLGIGTGLTIESGTLAVKTTDTKTGSETVVRSMGSLSASGTSSSAIQLNAYFSNSTTLIADITVYGIKSDGSASVVGKVTGRYRKNSSGTFSVDDAGTAVISDITQIASIVPEINGTNPQVLVTMGAASDTYQISYTAIISYVTY